jgi:hypothetical protein
MFSEPLGESLANLELAVNVYNINKGRNEELAKSSEKLKGYEFFVSLVKEYLRVMDRGSAIRRAVLDCIRQDVLKEFFEEHGSEVHNMLLSEWNIDDAKRVWQREAREDGRNEGIEEGVEKGMQKVFSLLEQGVSLAEAKKRLGLG